MEKIRAIIIVEMMGKPAEYLKETLGKYVERISMEKGIKILGKKIHEPKKVDNSELFSDFAEVELELESFQHLFMIIFTYMPSHIEITGPEEVKIKNFDMNQLCNDLTRRMLEYDAIAKKMIYERRILENQLNMRGEKPAIEPEKQAEKKPKTKKKTAKKKKR